MKLLSRPSLPVNIALPRKHTKSRLFILRACDFFDSSHQKRQLRKKPLSPAKPAMSLSKLPQNRHPERSASQIYRVMQRLAARSRRTPTPLMLPILLKAFRPPKPENRILPRYLGPRERPPVSPHQNLRLTP
jgi:hypothetical protein